MSRDESPCGIVHNVLILDNELGMGGLEKKLYDFASRIDTAHFRLKVCCLKEGGFFKEAFMDLGIPFYDQLLGHKYEVFAYRKLAHILHDEKIDLIYTFAHPNTLLFSFMARLQRLTKRVVVSFHASGSSTGEPLLRAYQKMLLGRVDRMIAVADAHKRVLVEREGLDASKIVVIHNGVDVGRYHPGPADPRLARELGFVTGSTIISCVASLKPLKRVDLFLGAAAAIAGEFDDVGFLVVGDGPERARLEQLAADAGIADRVVFAGVREDVADLYRLSVMSVLPSRIEAFPNVLLEAMASGIPVVATDVGSVREVVEDGRNGLVVAPEHVEPIAQAMRRLLTNADEASTFGTRGREIVESKFRLEGMCRKREQLFAELLCHRAEQAL